MAITGTGTQADPYKIHNYTDFYNLITGRNTYWTINVDFWAELVADIDADNITWQYMSSDAKMHLDMCNHSITNVHLENNWNQLLWGHTISNGTLEFEGTNRPNALVGALGNVIILFKNMVIRCAATFKADYASTWSYNTVCVFLNCSFDSCKLEITMNYPDQRNATGKSNTGKAPIFLYDGSSTTTWGNERYIKYSYIEVNGIGVVNNKYGESVDCIVANRCDSGIIVPVELCRLTGTIVGEDTTYNGFLGNDGVQFDTSVVDLDMSSCTMPTTYSAGTLVLSDATTTAINTDSLSVVGLNGLMSAGVGMIPCTTSEIRHYSNLNSKQFPITRTGDTPPAGISWLITDGYLPYLTIFDPPPGPEPPTPSDKAIYRYHTSTGWVKEGSIYVRENGAWSAGSGSIKILDGWSPKDWGTLYPRAGYQVWKHAGHIYYNGGLMSWEFDRVNKLWVEKTWVGLNFTSSDSAVDMWTDGVNRYYSYSNKQLVLNNTTLEWSVKSWNGYTPYYGRNIWTDDEHIYYSSGSNQYVLNVETSTWTPVTWGGLSNPAGNFIWHDDDTIYYSQNASQYVLDKSTATWVAKTWTGLQPGSGGYVWTDGTNIYFSDGASQFVLDSATSTWTAKTWSGLTSFSGMNVWTDDETYYYSGYSTSDQYYATGHVVPGPVQELKIHERVNNQWQDKI